MIQKACARAHQRSQLNSARVRCARAYGDSICATRVLSACPWFARWHAPVFARVLRMRVVPDSRSSILVRLGMPGPTVGAPPQTAQGHG
eukprot:9409785-Alexandrium_andersonii.AAC.1